MADTTPHGLGGYTNHQCRCDTCRAANAAWQRGARIRRSKTIPPKHGYNTYLNYLCRCTVCTQGNTDYARDYRRAHANG